MNSEANTKYDTILSNELTKRLKRNPIPNELANADNDSDLVNETLWQLIEDLYTRVEKLESQLSTK